MKEVIDNQEMMKLLHEERPNQIIHEVISFELNEYGFYDVRVDMQLDGGDNGIFVMPTIKHVKKKLPYPYSEYEKLSENQKSKWRWEW
jgi:hypothetical protein